MSDYKSKQSPMAENAMASHSPDLFDINEIFRAVWKRKISFLLPIILILGSILAFHALVPPTYTASARLLIDPVGLDVTRDIKPRSNSFSGNSEFVESKMRIVTSDEVLGKVVHNLSLDTDPEFGGQSASFLDKIKSALSPQEKTDENPYDKALWTLRNNVRTHKEKGSYVVDVFVKARSGQKAAKIANAIVDTYIDSQKDLRSQSARNTSKSLMKQLELFKKRLYKAEDAVEKYKARHNIINVRGNIFNEREMTDLGRELTRARSAKILAQEKYQQYKAMQGKPLSLESLADVTNSRTIMRLRSQYVQTSQRKAQLSESLLPSHPSLLAVNKQLKAIKALINQEIRRIVGAAKHEYERLKGAEERLAQKMAAIKKETVSVNLASVKLKELQRDVEVSRLVYKTNMMRAREIGEQESVNTSNSRVISPALAPEKSDRKMLPMLLLMGLVGGAVLGVLLAIIRERLSKYITSSHELRAISGLPVIKELPFYKKDLLWRLDRLGLGNFGGSKKLFRKMDASAKPKSMQKLVSKTLTSAAVMSSSQIRDLLYNYRGNKGRQTLFVMSSGQKDEKGAVTLNLALAASMAGDRVLLVDADITAGSLSAEIAPEAGTGIKAVIEGTVPLKEAVIEGYNETLHVLPVERDGIISNAINSHTIQTMILDRAKKYDLVIFDGGVTGINIHAHSFAQVSDDIIFIARENVTPVAQFKNIVQNMRPYNNKIRGTVFYNS